MADAWNSELQTSPDLTILRKDDEAILLDGRTLAPLHVRRGADLVIRVAQLKTDPFEHPALINLLSDHGILRKQSEPPLRAPPELPQVKLGTLHRMSLYLLLTHACNLACPYCFNGDETYQKAKPPTMSKAVARASLEWAVKKVEPGGEIEIVFFGGEPLLRWPLIRWFIEDSQQYLEETGSQVRLHYHLTSNLTRLPDDLIEFAQKFGMTFLCNVDGPKPIHDILRPRRDGRSSYPMTTRTISALREAGLGVALRSTVTQDNVGMLPEVVDHHFELGGNSSAMVPLNPISSDQLPVDPRLLAPAEKIAEGLALAYESSPFPVEQLHPFNEAVGRIQNGAYRRFACGAPGGHTPVIDAQGDIFPCIYFVGIPWLRMGNVFKDDGDELAHQVLDELCKHLDVEAIEGCRECSLRYLCAGGCPAMRILALNRLDLTSMGRYARKSSCAVARTITEKLLWREGSNE